jgi:hypothetical protein
MNSMPAGLRLAGTAGVLLSGVQGAGGEVCWGHSTVYIVSSREQSTCT